MTFVVGPLPVIVDASAAVEMLDGHEWWQSAFDQWAADDRMVLAPAHFLAEVANASLRGRRFSVADVAARIERLVAAGVELADRGPAGLIEAIGLADQYGLSVYDALYLQLALDVEGELATLDKDLRRAATAEGVPLT